MNMLIFIPIKMLHLTSNLWEFLPLTVNQKMDLKIAQFLDSLLFKPCWDSRQQHVTGLRLESGFSTPV